MEYKLNVKGLKIFAHHGAIPQEQELGQKFEVDLEILYEALRAHSTDNIEDTLNYVKVIKEVEETVKSTRFRLLESLAHQIANRLMAKFEKIKKVKVSVRKISVPLDGILDHVEISFEKSRS